MLFTQVGSFQRHMYPYVFEEDEATRAAVLRYDANTTYRAEEMVAFVLSYAKQAAKRTRYLSCAPGVSVWGVQPSCCS